MKKLKKILVKLLMISMLFTVNVAVKAEQSVPFSDVPSTAWYGEDLQYLLGSSKNIFSGYPDGTFKPNEPLTADMFIKLVVTAMGDVVEPGGDYWASAYIRKALEKGYIKSTDGFAAQEGHPTGPYESYKKPITRESMALIVGRALDLMPAERPYRDPLAFSSLIIDYRHISNETKSSVVKCYDLGILSGYPDGEFKPRNQLTRAEAVSVIRRLIDPGSRKVLPVTPAANPSPTPIPVMELNRPELKEPGKGIIEVEGIRIDPTLDYLAGSGGVMRILKAEEFVNIVLKYLRFYEFDGKARMRGYLPQLPEGYLWSFSIDCGVNEPDDRGVYGGVYTNAEEEQPEYKLPSAPNTFDLPLYTGKENIRRLVLTCEIFTADQKSCGKFTVSFMENKFTTDDFYGGFDGTYPFDGGSFFEWQ